MKPNKARLLNNLRGRGHHAWFSQRPSLWIGRRLLFIVVGVASLAVLALSPANLTVVKRLTSFTNVVYADGGPGGDYYSTDQGATWQRCTAANECYVSWPESPAIVVCDYEARDTCYRSTDRPEVDISDDGGKTWSVSWQIPPARLAFIQRLQPPDVPRELVISGGTQRYLLVAMGRDGILRKELPDGAWEQISVGDARPKPLVASGPTQAIGTVPGELTLWMGFGLVALLMTGIWVWRRCAPAEVGIGSLLLWLAVSVIASVVLFVLAVGLYVIVVGVLVGITMMLRTEAGPVEAGPLGLLTSPAAVVAILYAVTYAGFVLRLRAWARTVIADPSKRLHISRAWLLMAVGIMVIGGIPWSLWALGAIWSYSTAVLVAVGVTLLIAILGCFSVGRGIREPVG